MFVLDQFEYKFYFSLAIVAGNVEVQPAVSNRHNCLAFNFGKGCFNGNAVFVELLHALMVERVPFCMRKR